MKRKYRPTESSPAVPLVILFFLDGTLRACAKDRMISLLKMHDISAELLDLKLNPYVWATYM